MSPSIAYRRVRLCSGLALLGALLGAVVATAPPLAHAQAPKPAPDEMRWGLHVTLVSRWLDPAETGRSARHSWSCTRFTTRWCGRCPPG